MATAEKAIYDRLAAAPTFHPASAALFANDWALDAGDVVAVKSGEDTFSVPIYGMTLDWKGNSRVEIQSTGNEERKPISALKRRQFASGRGGYRQKKEIDGYYQQLIEEHGSMGLIAGALGVVLDADGNPVTDPTTGKLVYDQNSPAEMFSRLLTTPNYAELVSALNNGTQQISGAKINLSSQGSVLIQAINNRPSSQSSVIIDADKIDLTGYVTATALDARLINVDQLFAQAGYAGTLYLTGSTGISANGAINASSMSANTINASKFRLITGDDSYSTVSQKTVSVGGTVLPNLLVLGTGIATDVTIPNAIATIVVDDSPPSGKIGFKYTTFANSTPVAVNFNIADTAKYKADVGIASVSAAGWTNDGEGGGYYNTVTATPKAGSASTETVVLPTITVDTELGTNASTALQAYGPTVGSTKYPVSASTTVYLKADSDYCYITSNNNTPTVGTNVLARISNPGGGRGTVTAITATALGRHDTGVSTIGVSGTNLNAFAGDSTFSLVKSTYDTSSEATSSDHCVNLLHGSDIVGRINTESVYTDGITAGEAKFTLTTVTPQGASAGTIYKRKTSGSLRLVSQTITKGGTIHYYVRHTASETPTGAWYTRKTTKPSSGTTYNTECEYDGTATVYVSSSSGTYYYLGDGTDTTLYHEGTPDSTHYYTKTS